VQDYVLTIILMMLAGPAIIGQTAMITTMLQRNSADAFRGRMFSLVGAFWGVISLVSIVLGSAATSFFSPAEIMFGSGILYVGAGVGAVILLATPGSRGAGVDVAPISGSDENPARIV
jgi:hypothetical protein